MSINPAPFEEAYAARFCSAICPTLLFTNTTVPPPRAAIRGITLRNARAGPKTLVSKISCQAFSSRVTTLPITRTAAQKTIEFGSAP